MDNTAVVRQLESALARAKGNKTLAKRYLLEAAIASPSLLLALAEPFLDSIAGYALDLYARKNPAVTKMVSSLPDGEPPVQVSAKQKATMEMLAAAYKKKPKE